MSLIVLRIGCVSICTILILSFLFKYSTAHKHNKKCFYAAFCTLYLLFSAFTAIISIRLRGNENQRFIQLMLEGVSWLSIFTAAYLIFGGFIKTIRIKWLLKEHIFKNRIEKYLFWGNISLGLLYIIFIALNNIRYLFPSYDFGIIGDFYINTDISRGVFSASSAELPNQIHPCYRFILLPLVGPVALILRLMANLFPSFDLYYRYVLGYYICFCQVVFNSISLVLFYRILKRINLKPVSIVLGTIAFALSFSFIWLSIFPETYSVTLMFLLSAFYLFLCNKSLYMVPAVISVTLNPMAIVPLFPLGIRSVLSNRALHNYLRVFIRKHLIPAIVSITLLISFAAIFIYKMSNNVFVPWIQFYSSDSLDFFMVLDELFKYLIVPWFIGPDILNINPYLVHAPNMKSYTTVLLLFMLVICSVGIICKRRETIFHSIILTLLAAFTLHGIVGLGRYIAVIYTGLYAWTAIMALTCGMDFVCRKLKLKALFLWIFVIVFISTYNMHWIYAFGKDLSAMNFSSKIEDLPKNFYLFNKGKLERFVFSNKKIIRYNDQKTIFEDINCYYLNPEKTRISGLLENNKWFILYNNNNNTYININGEISPLQSSDIMDENISSRFFIFGMGLRDKFIFSEKDKGYSLVKYPDNRVIFEEAKCSSIDYENYAVNGILKDGTVFKIYENSDGIFMDIGNITKVLDDSVKINIPDFKEYKHSRQLKILFNEVLVNITKNGPTPNFMAYPQPWYRDGAMMAMVLERTGNLPQIENWIDSIQDIYDRQNGYNEPDNLGQLLYLFSLTEKDNSKMIDKIIREAEKLKGNKGYISGKTDNDYHPVYQTRWLIFGMKKLGLDCSGYTIPDINDSYASLMWFDDMERTPYKPELFDNFESWPYLYYARLHNSSEKIEYIPEDYPISCEENPKKANFDNLKAIGECYCDNKLVVPHGWTAAEMFLYLLEVQP